MDTQVTPMSMAPANPCVCNTYEDVYLIANYKPYNWYTYRDQTRYFAVQKYWLRVPRMV